MSCFSKETKSPKTVLRLDKPKNRSVPHPFRIVSLFERAVTTRAIRLERGVPLDPF